MSSRAKIYYLPSRQDKESANPDCAVKSGRHRNTSKYFHVRSLKTRPEYVRRTKIISVRFIVSLSMKLSRDSPGKTGFICDKECVFG